MEPLKEEHCGYLKPLTPKRELAMCISRRAFRVLEGKNFVDAFKLFLMAMSLDIRYEGPIRENRPKQFDGYKLCLYGLISQWEQDLKNRYPPRFPKIEMLLSQEYRRFPGVPWELERGFSMLEAIERLLNDPEHHEVFWEPLRWGLPTKRELPESITIDRTQEQKRYVQSNSRKVHPKRPHRI